jgi:putative effector of murein hydrolase
LLLKLAFLLCLGFVATLLFAANLTVRIRTFTATTLRPQPPPSPPKSFSRTHQLTWASAWALGGLALALTPTGTNAAAAALALFLLASTVVGFLLGSSLPKNISRVLHPLIVCATFTNASAAVAGALQNGALGGYTAVLRGYLTKGVGGAAWGVGDGLMAFLHCVILSFGFRVFAQRALMRRHGAEIAGTVLFSAAFSLFLSAAAGAAMGLPSELTLAIVPRSVTVALALPIAGVLGAGKWASVTATSVMFTGLLGANFAQPLLTALGFTDPIVRGLATASSAHGLGTAALTADEPDAAAFAAASMALVGALSTVLVTAAPVRRALLWTAGVF